MTKTVKTIKTIIAYFTYLLLKYVEVTSVKDNPQIVHVNEFMHLHEKVNAHNISYYNMNMSIDDKLKPNANYLTTQKFLSLHRISLLLSTVITFE